MTDGKPDEPVGSVGEEAAKLLGAVQEWARESGSEYADATAAAAGGAAGGAASSLNRVNEHLATGGEDCRYCPLCQVISAVRDTSPEVKQHLASAASSLLQAAAGALATPVPDDTGENRKGSPVERIDLTDDEGWEDDS